MNKIDVNITGYSEHPFIVKWCLREENKIYKAELEVKQKGLPRTALKMTPNKQRLALFKTIKDMKLKDFAKLYNVSYGVVRQWNGEPLVEKETVEYKILFAESYVQELEKRAFSKKLDIEKYSLKTTAKAQAHTTALLYEAKDCLPSIQRIIITSLMNRAETLPKDKAMTLQCTILALLEVLSPWTIYNPPKDKKRKEIFEQNMAKMGDVYYQVTKSLFADVKKMIKNGESERALKYFDLIEKQTLAGIKDNTDLKISFLNKGRSKGEIKREETVQPTEEKATNK